MPMIYKQIKELSVNRNILRSIYVLSIGLVILLVIAPSSVRGSSAIGPRVGVNIDSDKLVIGAEAELGRAFQNFRFAPSLDFELGDNTATVLNSDFRLYLFNLPESGLRFYGSAGPAVVMGNSQVEIGFSLVAGVKIPMKGKKRYNLETRFGFGEIPSLKVMFSILFGI